MWVVAVIASQVSLFHIPCMSYRAQTIEIREQTWKDYGSEVVTQIKLTGQTSCLSLWPLLYLT